MNQFKLSYRHLLGLTAVFWLPVWLARPLASQSLWADEASSVWFARMPVGDLLTRLCDPHPPGYYLLLKLWLAAGQQEFWLRLPSLLAAFLAIAMTVQMGREIGGKKMGWLAGLLLAWHPLQIWYATEVRMYLPTQLAGVAAFWLGWRLCHLSLSPAKARWTMIGYGVMAVLAVWIDFSALLPLVLLQLVWLGYGRPRGRLWLAGNLGVLLTLWLLFSQSNQLAALSQTYQPVFLAVQANRLGLDLSPAQAAQLIRGLGAGILVVSGLTLWIWARYRPQLPGWLQKGGLVLVLLAWMGLLAVTAVPRLFTVKRLLVVLLPQMALLVSYFLSQRRLLLQVALAGLSLSIALFILPGQSRSPWRTVVADMNQSLAADPGVVWVDELVAPAFAFYAGEVGNWVPLVGGRLPQLPTLMPQPGERLLLVTGNNPYRPLPRLLPASFYEKFEGGLLIEEAGIGVYEYRGSEGTAVRLPEPATAQEEWGLLLPSPLDSCGGD